MRLKSKIDLKVEEISSVALVVRLYSFCTIVLKKASMVTVKVKLCSKVEPYYI